MERTFVHTAPFLRSWKAMGLSDKELLELENILLQNPQAGDVIEGLDGARKVRIRLSHRGKSGGGRVIYVAIVEKEHLYLLFAYPKNVRENLSPEQEKAIKGLIATIKREELSYE